MRLITITYEIADQKHMLSDDLWFGYVAQWMEVPFASYGAVEYSKVVACRTHDTKLHKTM
jgi:hypothetical protein